MAKKNSDNKVYIETTLLMNLIKELFVVTSAILPLITNL